MSLKVGIAQFVPVNGTESNYQQVSHQLAELVSKGATLIIVPELWVCEYNMRTVKQYAETIPGPSSNYLCDLASQFKVWIIGGTIPEQRNDQLYNTCPVISPEGKIMGTYSKRHLFRASIPGKVQTDEANVFSPGKGRFCFNIGQFRIGVGVCFDVRFPDLWEEYVRDDCNVIVFPSAFTKTTGEMHWELLGRARAIDSQSWIVMVSSAYSETASFKAIGRSFVSNPMGQIVLQLEDGIDTGTTSITYEEVVKVRSQLPVNSMLKA